MVFNDLAGRPAKAISLFHTAEATQAELALAREKIIVEFELPKEKAEAVATGAATTSATPVGSGSAKKDKASAIDSPGAG